MPESQQNLDDEANATKMIDAVIIGAGFSGLFMLHRLRELGISAYVFEKADGVGGTWYWNCYPGARCDIESLQYSYSFSDKLREEWHWTERYAPQPEILRYLNYVADKFDLRKDIQFETRVTAAVFDKTLGRWNIQTDRGDRVSAKFCIMATGCLSKQFTIVDAITNNDDPESLWSNEEGNSQNTHRIVPSMATNYSKMPWIYEYNLTSQDTTQFGQGAGINADFMVCLTTNGIVRWKLPLESVPDMESVGISNIVSDRQGYLFYTISWAGGTIVTAKICRVTNAQTSHPLQKCIENFQLFVYIKTLLALNEKYDLLITSVKGNEIELIPAVLNKTTLDLLWVNRHFFGAGIHGDYRWDLNIGNIFWIGGDDHLLKFDQKGENLINNVTQLGGFGRDFVLDRQQQIIVRPWQNMSSSPSKFLVSSHDVSIQQIKLCWNWLAPPEIASNADITPPTIDENGTVYMSSMSLAFAIDSRGKTLWTSELATSSEMKKFELASFCITMNSKRQIVYIVSGSSYSHKFNILYFITAIHMDTGKIIKRIDLNLGNDNSIIPKCPVLIGDEMFYFSWLTGQYPQLVPFKVIGIQQL
ncbi:unnamed protein product [Rotaria sordida]|uniref:Uncharacterized protein n=1 Tax=Rotaria sordida TaxID=392033 RepID=A0A814H3H3_9BILA|nr:unnamed protein product [Rotaria sordida]CAF3715970.1 unnamed protein product [Rotaria sordida]